ncbi:MAG: flagellar hook-length control protein FliK [Lachnospira sp.]|nr:flagellar hook-length control protein FliK [Lachnospira sp.]
MVSSAISGMMKSAVSPVSGVDKQTGIRDAFDMDFAKAMSQTTDGDSGRTVSKDTRSYSATSDSVMNLTSRDNVKKSDSDVKKNETSDNNSDSLKSDISNGVSEIKNKIKDTMNVSDEEIEDAMEQLGMTYADMLDIQKVTDLVVLLSGNEDSLSFVTDSDAVLQLNSILDTLSLVTDSLVEQTGMNIEDIKDIAFHMFNEGEMAAQDTDSDVQNNYTDVVDVKQPQKDLTEYDSSDADHKTGDTLKEVLSEKIQIGQEQGSDKKGNDPHTHMSDKAYDGIEQITADMTQNIERAFSEIADDVQNINEVDIVRQVVEQIKVTAGQQLQSIEVMLNPENLGHVHVTVTSRQGAVTAQLTAQNEQVKAALENQMVALKEHFNNQGIKVEAVEITVQSHGFESQQNLSGNDSNQAQQERKTHRRLDLSSIDELDESEMTDSEIRARDSIVNGDSSVEYSA